MDKDKYVKIISTFTFNNRLRENMMSGVNKAIIVGRLGHDPDTRIMQNGEPVAVLSVATSEQWNDKATGEKREQTEWHRVVFYRRQAEVCGQYLRKGSLIYVEGRLRTRKWTDQQGIERYLTEIIGSSMQMLNNKNETNAPATHQPPMQNTATPTNNNQPPLPNLPPADFEDDEIPFAPIHHGFSKHSIYAR